jgi:hypothetical protein
MNENHQHDWDAAGNLLTRRSAIGLIGTALVPFTIPKSGGKAGFLSADEAFSIIEKWNGEALSTEEIERVFLATWPTMHRHGYNTSELPCKTKLRQFFDGEKLGRLLRLVRDGEASDRLYVALDSPLHVTRIIGCSVVGVLEWGHYVAWLKRSIIACFDAEIDNKLIWERDFSLCGLFRDYRLKSCP